MTDGAIIALVSVGCTVVFGLVSGFIGAMKAGVWFRQQFSTLGEKLYLLVEEHEKVDQQRHSENQAVQQAIVIALERKNIRVDLPR